MERAMGDMGLRIASHACTSCRSRKRKCDKTLPQCSLCAKKNLTCLYNSELSSTRLTPASDGLFQNSVLEVQKFPAVFFLDVDVFQKAQVEIPRSEASVPQYVLDSIGDFGEWRSIAFKFFETVHAFWPIVSKVRVFGKLLNPLCPRRNDVALLILCMRLVATLPAGIPMTRLPEYLAAKRYYAELEITGPFSPQVLQAGVLIALYEYGHGIYPVAFLSIGACARYGISSGMDGSGISQMPPPSDWIEVEERKRIWWAVLILDRAVNLGNPTRSLATQEPHPSSILPMQDELWDQGVLPASDSFTVSSPSSLKIGRFARFAQAIYLLGRVYKHVTDFTASQEFLDEESTQLRRTLQALAKVVDIEGQNNKLQFCTQAALCSRLNTRLIQAKKLTADIRSGILLLQESYCALPSALSPDIAFLDASVPVAESVAKEAARIAGEFMYSGEYIHPSEVVSPFIIHLFYRAHIIYWEKARNTGSGSAAEGVAVLTKVLKVMDDRWKVSGEYLEILQARELTYFT